MTVDEILNGIDDEMNEVHMVGGHHPTWEFDYYIEIVKSIREKHPDLHIKGFTAAEIDYFHRRWKIDPEESLSRLKEAGLTSMPGGGAEVFLQEFTSSFFQVNQKLQDGKKYIKLHITKE